MIFNIEFYSVHLGIIYYILFLYNYSPIDQDTFFKVCLDVQDIEATLLQRLD